MSRSKDQNVVPIAGGLPCPKCGMPMERWEHSREWRPQPGRGFYVYWDRCEPCQRIQHYHAAHRDAEMATQCQ